MVEKPENECGEYVEESKTSEIRRRKRLRDRHWERSVVWNIKTTVVVYRSDHRALNEARRFAPLTAYLLKFSRRCFHLIRIKYFREKSETPLTLHGTF